MSRPAIKLALRAMLARDPTAEEMGTFCRRLLEACPGGRVYISAKVHSVAMENDPIAKLVAAGYTIAGAARELGATRDKVRWVGRKTGLLAPRHRG